MDPALALLLKVTGGVAGSALSIYILSRLVSAAKKAGRTGMGGDFVGIFLTFLGPVISPVPSRDEVTETREMKRDRGEPGDPRQPGS